jgi:raffinose/stachyose/melibiose transport system substrate-binding protein
MITEDSEHPDAAAEFLDWYLQPEVQEKYWQAVGGSSGVKDVVPPAEEWPRTVKWREIIETHEAYPPTDQAFSNELMDAFFAIQDGIIAGQISPEEGAAQMEEQAEAWRLAHPEEFE